MLNSENKIWLELSAKRLGVRTESLANALIRQIRTELGLIESPNQLEDWIERSKRIEENLIYNLKESTKTLRVTQETLKATQLYLNQIQGTQTNITSSPTPTNPTPN